MADDLKTIGTRAAGGAMGAAMQARDRVLWAQTLALGALNVPTADDVDRLTRRVRDVSQRLESVEDTVDGADTKLQRLAAIEARLSSIEAMLSRIEDVLMPDGGEIDAER